MKKPIHILQVFTIMNRGGAESMIMNYYRNIDRSKVQFDFLVHRKERGAFDNEIEELGGKIYRLDPISFHNPFAYQQKLDVFFKTNKYNIIHSHLNAMSTFVLKIAKNNNIRIRIAHSHTSLPNLNFNTILKNKISAFNIFKIFYKNLVKKDITKYATHFFACEKKAAIWLFSKQNIKKVRIINNAIDAKIYTFNTNKSLEIKNNLNLGDKFIVGHVGNFNLAKNHLFIIDVFFEIQKNKPNSILLLVGDGNLKEQIINKAVQLSIIDKILFLGVRNDVSDLLQAMDVFLFPSLYEGLPVTLVEAQASGLKCFVSNVVDNSINFTGLIDFLSLKKTKQEWAKIILQEKNYERKNTLKTLINSNYDINNSALDLQKYYLNCINNI